MKRFIRRIFFIVCLYFIALSSYAKDSFLVTSASSGLGQAISEALAEQGHNLILAGRNPDKLERLKTFLERKNGGKYTVIAFDYSKIDSIISTANSLGENSLSGAVIIPPRASLSNGMLPEAAEWNRAFAECFTAPLQFVKSLNGKLKTESSIVIISGLTSAYFMPEYQNTNVLKIMWVAEIKNLAYQLRENKIRVNALSPGVVLTQYNIDTIQNRANNAQRNFEEQLGAEAADTPLGRYAQPKDVANTVEFLLSNKSKHINGVNLVIDGGLSRAYS